MLRFSSIRWPPSSPSAERISHPLSRLGHPLLSRATAVEGIICAKWWSFVPFHMDVIFSLLTLEAGWTPASSGQKSPSCFSSVHGACVSYLSRVYWFRLNMVLGRPSGPRSGANSQPAPSERGQDKRVCVCTSPCELTWVNSNDLFRGKKTRASLALMEWKK